MSMPQKIISLADTSVASYLTGAASWLAAILSMGASLGLVNIVVGVLSASWLATQLYRFWCYERYMLKRKVYELDK